MDIDSEPIFNKAGMSSLDEDLMERLRSITTSNREDLIAQFRATTNAMLSDEGCSFFLEMNNWSVWMPHERTWRSIFSLSGPS